MSKIKIYGELVNDTLGGFVTSSDQIVDKTMQKDQEKINQELDRKLTESTTTSYLTCSTEGNTVDKIINGEDCSWYALSKKIRLLIKMDEANTAQNPTLCINNTEAIPIWYEGAPASDTNTWENGDILDVYFDGNVYQTYPTNQPKIEVRGNILYISGKSFELTPADYYYVGWANLSRSEFRNLTNEQIENLLSEKYNAFSSKSYSRKFGEDSLFVLAYSKTSIVDSLIFTSNGQDMNQSLSDDSTAEHESITINGQIYHIWGISHPGYAQYDPDDEISITFK